MWNPSSVPWRPVLNQFRPETGSYLGLQVDVGQRHLGHLVEADGQRDGAEDEQAVVYGDPHQDDGLDVGRGHFDKEGANQIDHQEEKTDGQEDQVQRKSGGRRDVNERLREVGTISTFWGC